MDKKGLPFPAQDFLLNVMIGAGDGLIVPSALIAILASGGAGQQTIQHILLIVIFPAALVMGVGGYLTRKNADLQPRNFVKDELAGADREKTRGFFANLGMNEEMQQQALDEMAKDDEEWTSFVDRYDIDPSVLSPGISGLIIGISYAVAASIALLPFFFQPLVMSAFYISVAIALPLLFVLGVVRARLTAQPPLAGGLRLLLTGLLAITLSWFAARFFVSP
ncbi:MAG: hypothetical protein EOO09_06895 [Chitinophagaceae bacterium]|nr:MAG: hypothetical protein EOO09_06895 [Chitinophagaceae bacterium]